MLHFQKIACSKRRTIASKTIQAVLGSHQCPHDPIKDREIQTKRAHRRVWLLQKFLRKRSIDFPGCSRMYKDLFRALLHSLFLFMAKGQRKEMLSWCSAVGHIQRIFTSTLLQYNFSCSSVFASSARKDSESPFQTGLTRYVPGKHFCLLFPVCS